jgi:2-methylcitrate dehydratase PrpD
MPSSTALLAEYFSDLELEDAPERVVHEAKRLVLDTIGSLIAACTTEIAPMVRMSARLFGSGDVATICGEQAKAGLLPAIYANARLANALDFDETFPVGAHFGVGVVAAALGFAQAYALSGREFLTSVLAGYEFGGRVASYIGPVLQVRDGRVVGFPEVWGVAAPVVMAATAAAGRARKLSPKRFAEAIGLAGSNAPLPCGSHWSDSVDLPNCKYADAGWCAVAGAFATLSVELGSTGFSAILDGPRGLARMYGVGDANEKWMVDGLGIDWMLDDVTYKPWPTCRFTHYPLTALEYLLQNHAIDVNRIDEIIVETGPLAASGRFTNPNPRTFAAREFSYHHMVAMRLLGIPPGPRWLDAKSVEDPRAEALKAKIQVEAHPRGDSFAETIVRNQIRTMPGGIRIVAAGKSYRAEAEYALGDPWSAATRFNDDDIFSKFRSIVPSGHADRLIDTIMKIEQMPDINAVLDILGLEAAEPEYA